MAEVQFGSWMYHQTQINGERITTNVAFKNCLWARSNPTEVHIKQIPFGMYEDNLIPLFETVGIVMQFRLMMTHSGRNRGFGFVMFLDRNDAQRAIASLNNILVSSWCRLQLSISTNVRSLYLSRISDDFTVNGVINLILDKVDPQEIYFRRRNGRPCFVLKFRTHREAAVSRRLLFREAMDFGPAARTNWDFESS